MSGAKTNCPACGGPVNFKVGSALVVVCEYCRSVVARGDRDLEDLGKVAALADTGSLLEVGMQGRYDGVKFDLTGRAQLGHEAGGVWDEWYAHFADGRWGWVAEAQGRYYLTFEQKPGDRPPPADQLDVGESVKVPGSADPLTVAEVGVARAVSAEGEIPYRLVPGAENEYADLSGPGGVFGTIDYGDDPPTVYLGKQVTLDDLGIPKTPKMREREGRQVASLQVNCPQCGGPMALRAPDRTERVTCPNCASLLDCNQGNLKFLSALGPGKVEPIIPLGSTGEFRGQKWTVIGFMQRSVVFDGVTYYWEEYLLYEPREGFRWLVRSDDHWNYVETLPAGSARVSGQSAEYQGNRFALYQKADAAVSFVSGEFYWKVKVGERVDAWDFIRPPEMLSREASRVGRSKEVNWSLGTYLTPAEVKAAFGDQITQPLPFPQGVAPNQPFRFKPVYRYWFWLTLGTILLGIVFAVIGSHRTVFEGGYELRAGEKTQTFFSDKFELRGRRNVYVRATGTVSNGWIYVDGDLVEDATGYTYPFGIPITYYAGVEDGEAWSEGSTTADTFVTAPVAGTYSLRLEVERDPTMMGQQGSLQVRVEQGVPRFRHWLYCWLAVTVVALGVAVYHLSFSVRRWQNSDYSPFQQHSS